MILFIYYLYYLYYFIIKKEKTMQKKICVYGKYALLEQITANWFCRFWDGNFDVKSILFCTAYYGKCRWNLL